MRTPLSSARALAVLEETLLVGPRVGPLRLVAVDGKAGSGKSTFALALSKALRGAPVLLLDDFLSWTSLTDFWPRFEAQVLVPLFSGRNARYQARDWDNDPYGQGLGQWKDFPFSPLVILEGVGAARRELRSRLACAVWVETPSEVCLERGISRDGVDCTRLWLDWQQREAAFFEADPVRSHAHLIVDGQGEADSRPRA